MAIFSKLWGGRETPAEAVPQEPDPAPAAQDNPKPKQAERSSTTAGGWVVEHVPPREAPPKDKTHAGEGRLPSGNIGASRAAHATSDVTPTPSHAKHATQQGASVEPTRKVERDAASQQAVPLDDVQPVLPAEGWWPQTRALAAYLAGTEVHTYAFSVAANVILSLFPFIVLMLTVAQRVFHSPAMVNVLSDLMHSLLPTSQDFVMNNMKVLANPKKGTKLFSVFMLLVTSTGVFLPLEVALNNVWGVKKHRNYLENQVVSLGLAAAVGVLVLASVALTAGQRSVMSWIFLGHTDNVIFTFVAHGVLRFCAVVASILLFFLIYWVLPHRKIPAMAVLPTAIVVGLSWEVAKYLYVLLLPKLDFAAVYGPFRVSVGLMMWAFLSGLMLLAGAHFSATRYTLRVAREQEGTTASRHPAA